MKFVYDSGYLHDCQRKYVYIEIDITFFQIKIFCSFTHLCGITKKKDSFKHATFYIRVLSKPIATTDEIQ